MSDQIQIVEPIETGHDGAPGLPNEDDRSFEAIAARRPRKVSAGMWGTPEIAAVSVAGIALLGAVLLYTFVVMPSNRLLAKNRSEVERLEAERVSANTKYGEINDTEKQVGKLLTSADDFETRYLPASTNGRGAIYQRINGLIQAYSLTNTSGPSYAPLEPAEQKIANQSEDERGREKYRSLFPGVYIAMTVEGSYQNLRRFIREIETGNEFVVISSIELEPSDTQEAKPETGAPPQGVQPAVPLDPKKVNAANPPMGPPRQAEPKGPVGRTRGEVVALRIEMAAYFRRANYSPIGSPSEK